MWQAHGRGLFFDISLILLTMPSSDIAFKKGINCSNQLRKNDLKPFWLVDLEGDEWKIKARKSAFFWQILNIIALSSSRL
jgi:hypothetical protein